MSDIFDTPPRDEDVDAFLRALMNPDCAPGPTANYLFCCHYLCLIFFDDRMEEALPRDDIDYVSEIMLYASAMCDIINGVPPAEPYWKRPVSYIQSEDGARYGYIISLDDVKRECDCNFVGLMMTSGKKEYYTSEYYTLTNRFALCKFEKDGTHLCNMGEIASYEDFKKALIG